MNAKVTLPLDKFLDLSYRHGLDGFYGSLWPGLYFTDRGVGRLMNVAGFIAALTRLGQEDLARKLAVSLDENLTRLGTFGGKIEATALRSDLTPIGVGEVPRFKVVLGDDSTFGGFTIAWYSLVPDEARWKLREETGHDPLFEQGSFYKVFNKGTDGMFMPDGADRAEWVPTFYKYAFNGGLMCHGLGHETFSVDISSDTGPHWSIHT